MIPLATLRELFEYNYWARDRQLRACANLTQEEFSRSMDSSFRSLRDTLAHLAGAEWVWLDRWRGRSVKTPQGAAAYYKELLSKFSPEELSTVAAIEESWGAVEHEVRDYLAGLAEEKLSCPLTYINIKGETWSYPLWQTLLHVVNHQSYHRGQVTTLLRQLGAEAPPIDYLVAHDVKFQR